MTTGTPRNAVQAPAPAVRRTADSADFFDFAARGELLLRRCTGCGEYRGPQSALCWNCHTAAHRPVAAAGTGTLVSWSRVHRSPVPAIPAPYLAAIVETDEGPWLLTRLLPDPHLTDPHVTDPHSDDPRIGDAVELAVIPGPENVIVARPATTPTTKGTTP